MNSSGVGFVQAIVIGCVFVMTVELSGQEHNVFVSDSTTWITEPVTDDGLVDYRTWYNETLTRIDPEQNSAIDFLRTTWYVKRLPAEEKQEFCRLIGASSEKFNQGSLLSEFSFAQFYLDETPVAQIAKEVEFSEALKNRLNNNLEASAVEDSENTMPAEEWTNGQFEKAVNWQVMKSVFSPFRREEFPIAVAWLESNDEFLGRLDEIIAKPFCQMPLTSRDKHSVFCAATESEVGSVRRNVAKLLSVRISLNVGEGEISAAVADIKRIFRLARMPARLPNSIDSLVDNAIERMALANVSSLLGCEQLTEETLDDCLQFLNSLEPVFRCEQQQVAERIFELSLISESVREWNQLTENNYIFAMQEVHENDQLAFFMQCDVSLIDWNEILERTNGLYDRSNTIYGEPDPATRLARADEFDDEIKQLSQRPLAIQSEEQFKRLVANNRQQALDKLNHDVWLLFQSAGSSLRKVRRKLTSEYRADNNLQFARLGCAVRLFEIRHNKLPEDLQELKDGGLLIEFPLDSFTNEPFRYLVSERNVQIYCEPGDNWPDVLKWEEGTGDGGIMWKRSNR